MIKEKPCPHFSELSYFDISGITLLVNDGAKLEEDYPNPTLAQQEFYDNLMYILEQDPDVVFSVGDLELYDENTQEWFDQQVKDYMKENNITY